MPYQDGLGPGIDHGTHGVGSIVRDAFHQGPMQREHPGLIVHGPSVRETRRDVNGAFAKGIARIVRARFRHAKCSGTSPSALPHNKLAGRALTQAVNRQVPGTVGFLYTRWIGENSLCATVSVLVRF
eukprot:scaffold2335_cov175-Amphora_coffeaeformis.AAC.6